MSNFANLKAQVNLVALISAYTELRQTGNEYHGPCPFCGGNDRFVVIPAEQRWFCREGGGHCARHGDCFDFVQEKLKLDKAEAYAYLSNGYLSQPKSAAKSEYDWTQQKQRLLASHTALLANTLEITDRCRTYLTGRGITEHTLKAFQIGWEDKQLAECRESRRTALAISLPWFDKQNNLVALKFRYLELQTYVDDLEAKKAKPKPRTEKQNARGSIKNHVFGWQAFRPDAATLMLIEGEFNALSIWQATDFAVLSLGSRAAFSHLPADLVEIAQAFKRVLIWADEAEDSAAAAAQIPGAQILISQVIDGVKMDANQCLILGTLAQVLETAALPIPDLKRFALAPSTLAFIETGVMSGINAQTDRAKLDPVVALELLSKGASVAEIEAIFAHYPIGKPYAETGLPFLQSVAEAYAKQAGAEEHGEGWPYSVEAGRLTFNTQDKKGRPLAISLADFAATITQEVTGEYGERYFTIEGKGVRGKTFTLEIAGEDFGDTSILCKRLESIVGAKDPIHVGQRNHIGPAIKRLTLDEVKQTRVFNRTGWTTVDDKPYFLIPGREPKDTAIKVAERLPYAFSESADLKLGLQGLDLAMQFMEEHATIVVASYLLPPLAYHANFRDKRYGLFLRGLTGSQKTSLAMLMMCLYGQNWNSENYLIKLGQGTTANAVMHMATQASDVPLLIDNYKSNTGGGSKDLINLIHAMLEGGEKDRLTRGSELRMHRPIWAWPVFTGEDVPHEDAASLARMLVLPFRANNPSNPADVQRIHLLRQAQENYAMHLPAVGAAWVDWLITEDAQAVIKSCNFMDERDNFAALITQAQPDAVNPYRIATNLAINHLTWTILACHPTLGALAQKYEAQHDAALSALARSTVKQTAKSLDAQRFVDYLRSLVNSGRLTLSAKGESLTTKTWKEPKRDPRSGQQDYILHTSQRTPQEIDHTIGWEDGNGGAYILYDETSALIKQYTGDNLSGMTRNTIFEQLDRMGMIGEKSKGSNTKVIKVQGVLHRTLHLTAKALQESED